MLLFLLLFFLIVFTVGFGIGIVIATLVLPIFRWTGFGFLPGMQSWRRTAVLIHVIGGGLIYSVGYVIVILSFELSMINRPYAISALLGMAWVMFVAVPMLMATDPPENWIRNSLMAYAGYLLLFGGVFYLVWFLVEYLG